VRGPHARHRIDELLHVERARAVPVGHCDVVLERDEVLDAVQHLGGGALGVGFGGGAPLVRVLVGVGGGVGVAVVVVVAVAHEVGDRPVGGGRVGAAAPVRGADDVRRLAAEEGGAVAAGGVDGGGGGGGGGRLLLAERVDLKLLRAELGQDVAPELIGHHAAERVARALAGRLVLQRDAALRGGGEGLARRVGGGEARLDLQERLGGRAAGRALARLGDEDGAAGQHPVGAVGGEGGGGRG